MSNAIFVWALSGYLLSPNVLQSSFAISAMVSMCCLFYYLVERIIITHWYNFFHKLFLWKKLLIILNWILRKARFRSTGFWLALKRFSEYYFQINCLLLSVVCDYGLINSNLKGSLGCETYLFNLLNYLQPSFLYLLHSHYLVFQLSNVFPLIHGCHRKPGNNDL